jgi:hypothetical protein
MDSLFGENRSVNVIFDEEKTVVFVKICMFPQLPDIEEIIDFLKK